MAVGIDRIAGLYSYSNIKPILLKMDVQKTPFSKTYQMRVLHYDLLLAVVNLRHMEDTAESGHPKYVTHDPEFSGKPFANLEDDEKWMLGVLWEWWNQGMPGSMKDLRAKIANKKEG